MPAGGALTAMTFNVRYDEESDGADRWTNRRDLVADVIRVHHPDLLALQEPTPEQWSDVAARLAGMIAFDGGFVRASRFDLLERGVAALPPDASRSCAWVRLRDRAADRVLLFACAHVDTAEQTWLGSAKTIHAELATIARGAAVVLAGDFNCAAGSDAHRYLLDTAGYR